MVVENSRSAWIRDVEPMPRHSMNAILYLHLINFYGAVGCVFEPLLWLFTFQLVQLQGASLVFHGDEVD